ncbi:hypothetical protein MPSEU_000195100 [Mayamaea pseudoterrestris]|nr:hypothetical protein MPSEU_000195100 [Mayamaea pseudoterrestris]
MNQRYKRRLVMMDEPIRTFSNLEISCHRSAAHRETSASLDLYMTRHHKQPQHQEQEEVSFVFPANYVHKISSNGSSDDTMTTPSLHHDDETSNAPTDATMTHGPLHEEKETPSIPQQKLCSAVEALRLSPSPQAEEERNVIKKNVNFILDQHGNVACAYLESEGSLTEEEKQAVWWQPMEFKLFRRYCKKAAQLARNSEYSENFTKVYDACSKSHITDVHEHCHISRTHARGLEVVVFPTLVQARKLVVKGVVKTQEKLPKSMDFDQRAKVLSATSRCLTGRSRLLSRVFAVGDEEVAKDCYYSMQG